ncbi:hypothetical protein SH203_02852 [Brevundimonas sp. SH203]|uniref:hypothetical protein n=1 Tax=Brevundimonas sp. SH203 TaxID=345167 RepID=UPI0009CF0930|nr:hypothetical protein [Brevundimonas sp. SH203]GAW42436.1 hypothetical protein SH203_02852 [Brevundimonas sp. SH203]
MTDLTPDLVCRAGAALFGREWQAPLAALLNVNDRTIRRIASAARQGQPYTINQNWRAELATALSRASLDHELKAREASEVAAILRDDAA